MNQRAASHSDGRLVRTNPEPGAPKRYEAYLLTWKVVHNTYAR
ncbi:hypothetical protein [Dyadobacter crusticola]|nr:hypothetical protein [Dyadobacter crusticola]